MRENLVSFKKGKEGTIFEAALRIIKQKGFHKARMIQDQGREVTTVYEYRERLVIKHR